MGAPASADSSAHVGNATFQSHPLTADVGVVGADRCRPETPKGLAELQALLADVRGGGLDQALEEISRRQLYLRWRRLPEKIVLLRHGQSEGNVDRSIYTSKGDAHLELTPKGLQQARAAGSRLKELVGGDHVVVVVSPFERTLQTLLGLYQGGFPESQVGAVHVCSQIREQEFGNFQSVGLHEAARAEQAVVGRFYYRRPNAESSADVYDRVGSFWTELIGDILPKHEKSFGSCLVVTHGLTMRLMLMKIFQWSVETFETVWNVGNCCHITLWKDMGQMEYRVCPNSSFPKQLPWATRPIWIVFKSRRASDSTEEKLELLRKFKFSGDWGILRDQSAEHLQEEEGANDGSGPPPTYAHADVPGHWLEIDRAIDQTENKRISERAEPYTVLDYLTIPQPRTMQREVLEGRLIKGHITQAREIMLQQAREAEPLKWDEVEMIDWWGSRMSYQGKMLRSQAGPGREVGRRISDFAAQRQGSF